MIASNDWASQNYTRNARIVSRNRGRVNPLASETLDSASAMVCQAMWANERPMVGKGYLVSDDVVAGSDGDQFSVLEEDFVHKIKSSNVKFTRGSYGEVSITLKRCSQNPSASSTDGRLRYSLAAVKTIKNVITNRNYSDNNFGGFHHTFSQQRKQEKISTVVLNEILALRLLRSRASR